MRVYYFRFYWPSNLLFFVRCVTYISNLRKIGKTAVAIDGDRYFGGTDGQTNTQMILYVPNATNCIGQTKIYSDAVETSSKKSQSQLKKFDAIDVGR